MTSTEADRGQAPKVFFESLMFSDGTSLSLGEHSFVVICGPNNVGKSAALRETVGLAREGVGGLVVKSGQLRRDSDRDELVSYLKSVGTLFKNKYGLVRFAGVGYSVDETSVDIQWDGKKRSKLSTLTDFFCLVLDTEGRITGSDPPNSISLLKEAPTHPIHALQQDENLVDVISGYFRRAFGQDLIVHFGGGGEVPLYVGVRPTLEPGEHPLARTYLERLESMASPLQQQGDGMRSFATIALWAMAPSHPTMVFIDEPEAFLHPPQARLIGELLAKNRRPNLQMFVSTHSSDFLEGVLRANDADSRIVRLKRSGNINHAAILDQGSARDIASESLLRYSNVLDGIFHRSVVVCEADADSAFYNSILDGLSRDGTSDVLFTHGNGKASLAKIVRALRALNVPVSAIVDIDVLNDEVIFKALLLALKGDWQKISGPFLRFKKAVESRQNFLKVGDVRIEVNDALKGLGDRDPLTQTAKKKIVDAVAQSTPWEALKVAGRQAIPDGQMIADFDQISEEASKAGLWIVPVGQLESFCKNSFGGHGPSWLRNVLENFDLSTALELESARAFVARVVPPATDAA